MVISVVDMLAVIAVITFLILLAILWPEFIKKIFWFILIIVVLIAVVLGLSGVKQMFYR